MMSLIPCAQFSDSALHDFDSQYIVFPMLYFYPDVKGLRIAWRGHTLFDYVFPLLHKDVR